MDSRDEGYICILISEHVTSVVYSILIEGLDIYRLWALWLVKLRTLPSETFNHCNYYSFGFSTIFLVTHYRDFKLRLLYSRPRR